MFIGPGPGLICINVSSSKDLHASFWVLFLQVNLSPTQVWDIKSTLTGMRKM